MFVARASAKPRDNSAKENLNEPPSPTSSRASSPPELSGGHKRERDRSAERTALRTSRGKDKDKDKDNDAAVSFAGTTTTAKASPPSSTTPTPPITPRADKEKVPMALVPGSPTLSAIAESPVPGYHMLERLGKGAFGTVNKALKLEDGSLVAIKTVELSALPKGYNLEETMKEWELLRDLVHPNIVKVHGHVRTTTSVSFIFEFVEGGSLYKITKNYGTFPESLVAIYVEQVLQGLSYLHQNGIIHSDVKSANLLINKTGKVQLADFGIARRVPTSGAAEKMEPVDPSALGSPFWMAPEVILMTDHTFLSDIWSLGVTVIELLTGDPPYIELPPMSAMFRIVEDGKPPIPTQFSQECQDFLELCFQEHEKRPTAKTLLEHKWLHQSSNEEKKVLAKSLSRKNIYDTIRKLQPPSQTRATLRSAGQDSDLMDMFNPSSDSEQRNRARVLRNIGDVNRLDEEDSSSSGAGSEDEGDAHGLADRIDLTTAKVITRLQAKRAAYVVRLEKLERNQTAVSRLESLYAWKTKDETARQRWQRYRSYLQTVEEQIDKVKGNVYIQARAVKDHHYKDPSYLYFNRGDVIYVHSFSAQKGLWTGEKQYETVIGKFHGDCVKMKKKDKRNAKGGSLPRIFASKSKLGSRTTVPQEVLSAAEAALQDLDEDERHQAAKKQPGKKQIKQYEGQVEELKEEVSSLRAKLLETEARLKEAEQKIHELEEENKGLKGTVSPRTLPKRRPPKRADTNKDSLSKEKDGGASKERSELSKSIENGSNESGGEKERRRRSLEDIRNSTSSGESPEDEEAAYFPPALTRSPSMIRAVRTRNRNKKPADRRGETLG